MPDTAAAPRHLALEAFVPYRLSILSNTVSDAIAALYRDRFGLAVAEWRVMAVVGRFGPLGARAVCARTRMDKVTVSRAVARLVARGLLARRVDAADRRRARLRLTARGRAMHDEIVPLAHASEAALLDALDADERVALDALLGKLQAHADALRTVA